MLGESKDDLKKVDGLNLKVKNPFRNIDYIRELVPPDLETFLKRNPEAIKESLKFEETQFKKKTVDFHDATVSLMASIKDKEDPSLVKRPKAGEPPTQQQVRDVAFSSISYDFARELLEEQEEEESLVYRNSLDFLSPSED